MVGRSEYENAKQFIKKWDGEAGSVAQHKETMRLLKKMVAIWERMENLEELNAGIELDEHTKFVLVPDDRAAIRAERLRASMEALAVLAENRNGYEAMVEIIRGALTTDDKATRGEE